MGGGKPSKQRSLRVLYHALFGQSGVAAGGRLIDAGGLRTIFGMFMKKVGLVMILINDVSANSL
jgi:beta-catenin-like protein 1